MRLLVILLFFITPSFSSALQLEDLNIFSSEAEPFNAEIGVDDLNGEKAENIRIIIPEKEEFADAGIIYNKYNETFNFKFVKVNEERGIIQITNTEIIPDSKIAILITVQYSNGGVTKEYAAKKKLIQEAPKEKIVEPDVPVVAKVEAKSLKIDISTGDNLKNIAQNILWAYFDNNVSVEQIMTALRRNNISQMKKQGYVFKNNVSVMIPDYNAIISQSADDAKNEINTYFKVAVRHRYPTKQRSSYAENSSKVEIINDSEDEYGADSENQNSLEEEKNNITDQISDVGNQENRVDNVIELQNEELSKLQKQLRSNRKEEGGFFNTMVNFLSDIMDSFIADPIFWILLAIIFIIATFVIKTILFAKSSINYQEMARENAFDDQQPEMEGSASKFELARAFIDMGNVRQAKMILKDIIMTGNPQEKQEAQMILSNIG
jgi:FimV-like protein